MIVAWSNTSGCGAASGAHTMHSRGVVAADRQAAGARQEHHRDRVLPRIAPGIGVDVEQLGELDVEPGLLLGLADRRVGDPLALVDEPAGQGEAARLVAAHDEHDLAGRVGELDHDVDGGRRVPVGLGHLPPPAASGPSIHAASACSRSCAPGASARLDFSSGSRSRS